LANGHRQAAPGRLPDGPVAGRGMQWLARVCAVAVCAWLGQAAAQAGHHDATALPTQPAAWPDDPLLLARVLVARAEHASRPFAVVDKRRAQILVFDAEGVLVGRSPALLGRALGDASVPGVGQRTQEGRLRDDDLTTPAGRFISEPGRNRDGEAIVWVDYETAFAIHRLRGGPAHASRSQRLAGNDPLARRVSAGCVVVPAAFYDRVVEPLLGRQRGLVLVMPERPAATPA